MDELDEWLNRIEGLLAAKARAIFEGPARRTLATIEHLTYLGEGDAAAVGKTSAALAELRREAIDLRSRLLEDPPEPDAIGTIEALGGGSHPLAKLARAVCDTSMAGDLRADIWADVFQCFGREVFTALVAGKLSVVRPEEAETASSGTRDPQPSGLSSGSVEPGLTQAVEFIPQASDPPSGAIHNAPPTPAVATVDDDAHSAAQLSPQLPLAVMDNTALVAETDQRQAPNENTAASTTASDGPDSVGTQPLTPAPKSSGLSKPPIPETGPDGNEFPEDYSSAELVGEFLGRPNEEWLTLLSELVWQLIDEGHTGLAFDIVSQVEKSGHIEARIPPTWAIRASAIGPKVIEPNGEIANLLSEDWLHFSTSIFEDLSGDSRDALRLLLAAGALRPSVVAPTTGAPAVLKEIHLVNGLPAFYAFCQAVADIAGRLYRPLDPLSLKTIRNLTAWQKEMDSLSMMCATNSHTEDQNWQRFSNGWASHTR